MIFLTPCESCNRHVLSSEVQCPFCSAPVTTAMKTREPRLPTKRLGRAAMVAFSATVATGATVATTACGGDEDSDDTRQASSENTSMPSGTPSPSASGSMGNLPGPTPSPAGTPTSPPGEPMAVALYGVAIDPGAVPPAATMPPPGATPPPPVSPVMEPEPVFAADYGAPPLEPSSGAAIYGAPALEPTTPPQGTGGAAPLDPADGGASTADAGAADAGTEPIMEPEPLGVAEYGVPPLEFD